MDWNIFRWTTRHNRNWTFEWKKWIQTSPSEPLWALKSNRNWTFWMKGVDSNISRWTTLGAGKQYKLSHFTERHGFKPLPLNHPGRCNTIETERFEWKEWIQTSPAGPLWALKRNRNWAFWMKGQGSPYPEIVRPKAPTMGPKGGCLDAPIRNCYKM